MWYRLCFTLRCVCVCFFGVDLRRRLSVLSVLSVLSACLSILFEEFGHRHVKEGVRVHACMHARLPHVDFSPNDCLSSACLRARACVCVCHRTPKRVMLGLRFPIPAAKGTNQTGGRVPVFFSTLTWKIGQQTSYIPNLHQNETKRATTCVQSVLCLLIACLLFIFLPCVGAPTFVLFMRDTRPERQILPIFRGFLVPSSSGLLWAYGYPEDRQQPVW